MEDDHKTNERISTDDALRQKEEDNRLRLEKDVKERTTELYESKELLQATIDSTLDIIQVFTPVRDKDNKIVDFRWIMNNKQGVRQNGDVIGQTLLSKNPGVIDTGIFEKMIQTVETGIPVEHEQFYDYEQFNGWFYQALVKSGDGLVMTSRDITQQKKAEAEILRLKDEVAQKATDKYYSIFNSIDEGFCIYELVYDNGKAVDLRWVEVNPAYEKQTGLKDTVGKLASDVMPGTENYWLEVYDQVAKTGEAVHFESWHEPTGRWYNTFASRLGKAPGNQVAVLFADVTERKGQEQIKEYLLKLSDALRSVSDPVNIQETAAEILGKYLKASRSFYYEVEALDGNDIHVINKDFYLDNITSLAGRYARKRPAEDLFENLYHGKTLVVNDINKIEPILSEELEAHLALGIQSYITVPFLKDGKYVAGMNVQSSVARTWTKAEVQIAEETAERTRAAVEKARAEVALQKSEEKYRKEAAHLQATLKSMNDAVYIGDAFGITLANQAALDQLGYSTYEELNKNIGILAKEIETRDAISQEVITAGQQAFARALRGEHVVQNVQVRHIKSGEERIVRSAASPVIVDEKIVAAVAINTDVTEQWKLAEALRENEERQSFLLSLSDVLRPLVETHEIQKAAMKLLAEYFEVMRATYFEVQADQDTFDLTARYEKDALPIPNQMHLSDFSPDLANDYRSGRTLMVTETENEAHSEAYRAIGVRAWLAVPLVKNGWLVAILGVQSKTPRRWTDTEIQLLEDVAQRTWAAVERAKAEKALRESESQLKQLLKMRDEFISIASHELKTPITSMKIYGQIVQKRLEEIGDTDNRDLLSKLNTQVNRLTALINSLLDTTKISEGQLKLNLEQLDINELLVERISEIKTTSNHRFELQLEDMPQVTADRERIGQVITNLLSNAIKYSPKETTISITSIPGPDGVVVTINDEGYGIPEQDIGRIFEKFFRVTANNMDTFPGMGLGLYITTEIIHKHHGTVSAHSVEGKGSTFSFTLPYKQ